MIERMRMAAAAIPRRTQLALLGFLGLLTLVPAAGRYAVEHGISFREVIPIVLLIGALRVVLEVQNGLVLGLMFWLATFGVGYRTIHVTTYFRLHPSTIILWGLLALLLIQEALFRRRALRPWIPVWLLLFIPFWLLGWVKGAFLDRSNSLMLTEALNFISLIPLYLVTKSALKTENDWSRALSVFFLVGTALAIFGMLEYFFPGIHRLFPELISDPNPTLTAEGFQRAVYSFWGSPTATFICALSLPFGLVVWKQSTSFWKRTLIVLCMLAQGTGIVIGGFRSLWFLLEIMLVLWLWERFGIAKGSLIAVALLLAQTLLPLDMRERLESMLLAASGTPEDSSGIERWNRARYAYRITMKYPLGQGWAGVGWPHSDFLQVSANLGLMAGVLFLLACVGTLLKVWRHALRRRRDQSLNARIGVSLALAFLGVTEILAVEGIQALPQLILPVWFVWVLADLWVKHNKHGITDLGGWGQHA